MKLRIRQAQYDSERHFAGATWINSFMDSTVGRSHRTSVYKDTWHQLIQDLIHRSTLLVAFDADAPANLNPEADIIAGWLCVEQSSQKPILHYAYTRKEAENQGVQRALMQFAHLNRSDFYYTHRTTDAQRIVGQWLNNYGAQPEYSLARIARLEIK